MTERLNNFQNYCKCPYKKCAYRTLSGLFSTTVGFQLDSFNSWEHAYECMFQFNAGNFSKLQVRQTDRQTDKKEVLLSYMVRKTD